MGSIGNRFLRRVGIPIVTVDTKIETFDKRRLLHDHNRDRCEYILRTVFDEPVRVFLIPWGMLMWGTPAAASIKMMDKVDPVPR